uniref:Uncharacterized protein n=1 Tax=Ditylum brightwellii TaxID=49249 RepID=A0A6S9CM33_9STRA|mmetsp:Transcript_30225/g.40359  ORF Transcript_30225/g.40359 Transcript_30225/m.40359 type:complete len:106 (+) Transcript_30225:127-444(+)
MSNPITTWIKTHMETYDDIERRMEDRVAENAILSVKTTDERHGPHRAHNFMRHERRVRGFNHFFFANSSLKGTEGGCANSFKAARYYMGRAADERDAILEKIAKE